jgi:hypothetical protein
MVAYGDNVSDPGKTCMLHSGNAACYEEDHLISLENGGNWPEPYFTTIDGKVVGAVRRMSLKATSATQSASTSLAM